MKIWFAMQGCLYYKGNAGRLTSFPVRTAVSAPLPFPQRISKFAERSNGLGARDCVVKAGIPDFLTGRFQAMVPYVEWGTYGRGADTSQKPKGSDGCNSPSCASPPG
jgi:hypothetical protein